MSNIVFKHLVDSIRKIQNGQKDILLDTRSTSKVNEQIIQKQSLMEDLIKSLSSQNKDPTAFKENNSTLSTDLGFNSEDSTTIPYNNSLPEKSQGTRQKQKSNNTNEHQEQSMITSDSLIRQ